jgi:release factor glutamine methyltransferase
MTLTIQAVLAQIKHTLSLHSETPTLDAQVLVAHFLGKPRTWVLAHPDAMLNQQQNDQLIQASDRLKHGEPLPYVIEHWEFFGMDFYLTPDVLIPRPETELLVERSLGWLRLHPRRRRAIDVGTGSGCVGISLAMNIPDLHVLLTDISFPALNVAMCNAQKYGLSERLEFIQADLLDGITQRFDLICANLPYIPSDTLLKLPVSKREPHLALDGGQDGIQLIARLLNQARNRMTPGGLIIMELESSQGVQVKTMAESLYPATNIQVLRDLSGLDRCVEIMRSNLIIHLCQRQEWMEAQQQGLYITQSLIQIGFIHCSQPEEILQITNQFYQGRSDLVLLWIDPEKITSEIRWEISNGTFFPHIYGPIDLAAVVSATDLESDIDGKFHQLQVPN